MSVTLVILQNAWSATSNDLQKLEKHQKKSNKKKKNVLAPVWATVLFFFLFNQSLI